MPQAVILGVSGFVPDRILSNADLEKMMDTSDEWISSRTGIKERRVLDDDKAVVHIGVQSVKGILQKTGLDPTEVDMVICATCTGDYILPDCANSICHKAGLTRAFGFDISAACSGFIFALYTAAQFIETGAYKKIIVIGGEKLTSYMDYTDRTTSIIFGDGGGGVLLGASEEEGLGIIDAELHGDGRGCEMLRVDGGGSLHPIRGKVDPNHKPYVSQEGKTVFKRAVQGMSSTIKTVMDRNDLDNSDIAWLVPHQANLRIIHSVANMMDFPLEQVMINIEKYGNTSAGTIPLCLSDYESQLKKGDGVMLTAFGGGFTWGSIFLRWAYDSGETKNS